MDRTALPPGSRLGEFEIVRVLAAGGFGIVYLARDHSLDREVAVKEFMPTSLAVRGPDQSVCVRCESEAQTYALGLNSFIDEARLLARLSHPAIVKVYHFWKANGTGYMVMPYLRGPTLGDVRRSMTQPPTEAWMRQITGPLLDALAMLHAQGFYHRDIAPDNVLVCDSGRPVLLDFGAARRVMASRTQSVTAIVKPHYAPIEQYAEARLLRQGPWTDLYALGALVAFLLDGVPPPASTARTVHDEMQTLALRRMPGVSTAFLAAIDWALAVRPQDRPQRACELRDALDGRLTPPPRPQADASLALRFEAGDQAVSNEAVFPLTQQLGRSNGNDAGMGDEHADRSALVTLARTSAGPRGWRWSAAAVAAAAAMVFAAARLPFDGTAAASSPTAGANQAAALPAPVLAHAEAVASERTLADLQSPAPLEVRAQVEESIEKSADKVVELAAIQARSNPVPTASTRVAAAQSISAQATPVKATKAEASIVKTNPPVVRQYAPQRRASSVHPRLPGPVELCAQRNFFIRPWCVQRRCEEPRFERHPQCAPRKGGAIDVLTRCGFGRAVVRSGAAKRRCALG